MGKTNTDNAAQQRDASENGRSHLVFVAVGVAIILGGLWLLYASEGPYHPDFPVSENEGRLYNGS